MLIDRVKETTTTTGTGNVTLAGATTSFQSFNAAFGVGVAFYYAIVGGAEWETGYGILTSTTTLVRTSVIEGTNGTSAVNFSAGTKDVFCTAPGEILHGADQAAKIFNSLFQG